MNLLPADAIGIGKEGTLAGFRPEHVLVGNGNAGAAHYQAHVEVVEYLGNEQLAHLRLRDEAVVAKLPLDAKLEQGRDQTFSVPLDKILLFDSTSEQTLGTAG
jgi:ABC-type sugar transport system ATPase subunit